MYLNPMRISAMIVTPAIELAPTTTHKIGPFMLSPCEFLLWLAKVIVLAVANVWFVKVLRIVELVLDAVEVLLDVVDSV